MKRHSRLKALLYESEVLDTFLEQLESAGNISIAEALITSPGLELVMEGIERFLQRGGCGRVVVGFDLATSPDAVDSLLGLHQSFPKQWEVRRFQSGASGIFHPKFILFQQRDRRTAIVGSANLTGGGWQHNHEANILITDTAVVKRFAEYFDELFLGAYARKITSRWLSKYRNIWKTRANLRRQQEVIRRKVRNIKAEKTTGPVRIKGHTFAFTGRIPDYPRQEILYPLMKKLRGKVASKAGGMSTADCLVHADIGKRGTTQKLKKADQYGIPKITKEAFFKLVSKEKRLMKKHTP